MYSVYIYTVRVHNVFPDETKRAGSVGLDKNSRDNPVHYSISRAAERPPGEASRRRQRRLPSNDAANKREKRSYSILGRSIFFFFLSSNDATTSDDDDERRSSSVYTTTTIWSCCAVYVEMALCAGRESRGDHRAREPRRLHANSRFRPRAFLDSA